MYFFPLISYSLVEVGAELNSAHICIIVFAVIFPSKFYCSYKYSIFIIFFLSPRVGRRPLCTEYHYKLLLQPLFQSLFFIIDHCGTPALRSTHLLSFTYLKIRNRIANVCASRSMGAAQNINLRKPRSIFISPRSRSISFAVVLSCSLTSASVSSTCLSA